MLEPGETGTRYLGCECAFSQPGAVTEGRKKSLPPASDCARRTIRRQLLLRKREFGKKRANFSPFSREAGPIEPRFSMCACEKRAHHAGPGQPRFFFRNNSLSNSSNFRTA